MQAVIETSTRRVVFLLPDHAPLKISEFGLTGAIRAVDILPETHQIETASENPDFVGGVWKYDGAWDYLSAEIGAAWEARRAAEAAAAAKALVPAVVSMRQARLALLGAGKLADVNAAIDALPEPDRSAALIEWEYSTEVRRDYGFVVALGQQLGLTDEQLDAMFVTAATL